MGVSPDYLGWGMAPLGAGQGKASLGLPETHIRTTCISEAEVRGCPFGFRNLVSPNVRDVWH